MLRADYTTEERDTFQKFRYHYPASSVGSGGGRSSITFTAAEQREIDEFVAEFGNNVRATDETYGTLQRLTFCCGNMIMSQRIKIGDDAIPEPVTVILL